MNELKLVRTFFPVKDIWERISFSDETLIFHCSDGECVVTSKMLLSISSKVIRDTCKDIPESDDLTLIIPFPKHLVATMGAEQLQRTAGAMTMALILIGAMYLMIQCVRLHLMAVGVVLG